MRPASLGNARVASHTGPTESAGPLSTTKTAASETRPASRARSIAAPSERRARSSSAGSGRYVTTVAEKRESGMGGSVARPRAPLKSLEGKACDALGSRDAVHRVRPRPVARVREDERARADCRARDAIRVERSVVSRTGGDVELPLVGVG